MSDSAKESPPKCSQCDRPAIAKISGHLLCLYCYKTLQEIHSQQLHDLFRQYNKIVEQMEFAIGIPLNTPKYRLPEPLTNTMTLNNFNIHESKIGVINTGEVQRIEVAMEGLHQGRDGELATAIRDFTNAIISTEQIPDNQKNDLLQQLAEVSEQAALPPAKRKDAVIKAILDGMQRTATTVDSLAITWSKVQPILQGILG